MLGVALLWMISCSFTGQFVGHQHVLTGVQQLHPPWAICSFHLILLRISDEVHDIHDTSISPACQFHSCFMLLELMNTYEDIIWWWAAAPTSTKKKWQSSSHPVIQSFNIADTETNTGHCQPLIPFAIQLLVATSPAHHFHRNGNVACMFLHNLCHSIRHCWFLNSTVLIPGRYCKGGSHCPEIWPRKCLEDSGVGDVWLESSWILKTSHIPGPTSFWTGVHLYLGDSSMVSYLTCLTRTRQE